MNLSVQSNSDQEFFELLELARQGDADALGQLIDRYRPFLMKVANAGGDTDLQAKVGDSDLVQDACMDAVQSFRQFRGRTSKEMLGWLRQILLHRLSGARDQYLAEKRAIAAEVPMPVHTDDSHENSLAASATSPSEQVMRQEERDVLESALASLSDLDRAIIEMRQKDGQAFAEIARRLDMTEEAAQKRWVRALHTLQQKVRRLYGLAPG